MCGELWSEVQRLLSRLNRTAKKGTLYLFGKKQRSGIERNRTAKKVPYTFLEKPEIRERAHRTTGLILNEISAKPALGWTPRLYWG